MHKMKLILPVLLFLNFGLAAQESKQFVIEGKVKQKVTVDLASLKQYKTVNLDSITILNHLLQRKSVIKDITAIDLKDILSTVQIDEASPKKLSEYYLVFTATDNYKVVFSWNEIFNTKNEHQVLVLLDFKADPEKGEKGNIAIITPSDIASGRRFVKGLSKISILQAK